MLPQHLRLRKSADFASVIKQGRKVLRPTLILYARSSEHARFGVIVGKAIGGAVERNRVKRRLRHGAYSLMQYSQPMDVVVRALPGGAATTHAGQMAQDLASAWTQAAERVAP